MPRATAVAILTVVLTACVSAPPPEAPEGAPADFPGARYQRGEVWQITASELTVRVYRDGPLKRLGHNHIVSTTAIAGFANRRGADLYVPAAALVVDDPALRAAAGDGFTTTPSLQDIVATRRNLLGPDMLDAARYPFLRIGVEFGSATRWTGTGSTRRDLAVTLTVAGATTTVLLPVRLDRVDATTVSATSRFAVSHTELGLRRFSALAGAITVADRLDCGVSLTLTRR